MQVPHPFNDRQTAKLEALCADMTQRIGRKVTPEYGETDDGDYRDVALCIDSLPAGAWGKPGPLVTLLAGPHVARDGFTVMGADGVAVVDNIAFEEALKAARFAGVREYRAMCEGALATA
ncbi:hypothetical protein [Variovorax sp. PBL-E5]|uniref:hypothetical protein n=1 Tax=Variovorax sp. PBL-E5 TaxID=434014 RepID=UPI001316E784|nr:hypothetical protein [Variovorax sp. PBL-E5]VTU29922.1 hypothetical protein E5CHR_02909 [Variovorax sp. PBL-E5]